MNNVIHVVHAKFKSVLFTFTITVPFLSATFDDNSSLLFLCE